MTRPNVHPHPRPAKGERRACPRHAALWTLGVVVVATLLVGCASAPATPSSWDQTWRKVWTIPAGGRICAAAELASDQRGGAYVNTPKEMRPADVLVEASSKDRTSPAEDLDRYWVSVDGVVSRVDATTSPVPIVRVGDRIYGVAPESATEGTSLVAVVRGDEGPEISVMDRDGRQKWDASFNHRAFVTDIALDPNDELWVVGGFRDALDIADRHITVGPPHPATVVVPRFGQQVATRGPGDPAHVRDGFVLRFDRLGNLAMSRVFHSGMKFVPSSLALAPQGVVIVASVTGSIPDELRSAASAPLPSEDPTKLTLMIGLRRNGVVTFARKLDGVSYGGRVVSSSDRYVVFLGLEDGGCALSQWTQR